MSWRTRLGQLAAEFGEDVVQQASRVLARDATEAQARKTLERIVRTAPEGVDFAVPRRRVKPKVRTDNPGGDWLKHTRRRAAENYSVDNRVTGPVTGYLKRPIELDPQKLAVVPGARGERRVPGEAQYDRLRPSVEEHGLYPDSPILVGINHLGDPYIIEGNTRAAVARDLGLRSVPAEVRWFAGGEGAEGPMMPELLEKYMPPSELSLDPNFRRWFGDSRLVDEYGEPLMMFHGTRGDVTAFDPTRIGQSDFGASGRGFYFSQDPGTAGLYSQMARGSGDPSTLAAYLSARNPLELGAFLPRDASESALLTQRAREAGHDAIFVRSPRDDMLNEVVVFEPTQIKSATGNRGTYDPNDPDIRKARGGLAVKRKGKRK